VYACNDKDKTAGSVEIGFFTNCVCMGGGGRGGYINIYTHRIPASVKIRAHSSKEQKVDPDLSQYTFKLDCIFLKNHRALFHARYDILAEIIGAPGKNDLQIC